MIRRFLQPVSAAAVFGALLALPACVAARFEFGYRELSTAIEFRPPLPKGQPGVSEPLLFPQK